MMRSEFFSVAFAPGSCKIGPPSHRSFELELGTSPGDRRWYPVTSGCGRFGTPWDSIADVAKSSEGRLPVHPPEFFFRLGPLFLPPPVSLFTVAQARASAVFVLKPFFL